jgi:hypothetical protein
MLLFHTQVPKQDTAQLGPTRARPIDKISEFFLWFSWHRLLLTWDTICIQLLCSPIRVLANAQEKSIGTW